MSAVYGVKVIVVAMRGAEIADICRVWCESHHRAIRGAKKC